jgi:parallel beta-helix repeat protein
MKKIKQLFISSLFVISLISCEATVDSGNGSDDKGGKVEIPENHTIERDREEGSLSKNIIGAREVKSTPLSSGTLFVSVTGEGEECKKENPCGIRKGFAKARAGDVLFLRGGIYKINSQMLLSQKATKDQPIIIESYPGEKAVIEGKFNSPEYTKAHAEQRHTGIKFNSAYVFVRKIEIRYMGHEGVMFLYSSNNTIEGCNIHHNMLSGVVAYGGTWNERDPKYTIPYKYGQNIIRDNIVHHNSDAGMNGSRVMVVMLMVFQFHLGSSIR